MRIGLIVLSLAVVASAGEFGEDDLRKEFAELKAVVKRALEWPPGWNIKLRVVRNEAGRSSVDPTELDSRAKLQFEGRRRSFGKQGIDRGGPLGNDREPAIGWYEADKGEICVVGPELCGMKARERRIALLHELIHAYRFTVDQVHGLGAHTLTGDFDRAFAERCVMEGDASLLSTLMQYGLDDREDKSKTLFTWLRKHREVALLYQESMRDWATDTEEIERLDTAPYRAGMLFCYAVYSRAGLHGLRAALVDPPATMEQVLHPEKYLSRPRETPTLFARPEPLYVVAEGWKCVDAGILGEFHLRMALQAHLSRERAEQASAGWDGSIYQLYAPDGGDNCLLAVITSWDRDTDAMEFEEAWREMAKLRDKNKPVGVTVERRGRKVLVLDGTKGLDCAPIRGAFWGAAAIAGTRAR